jgi:hypothetical protein
MILAHGANGDAKAAGQGGALPLPQPADSEQLGALLASKLYGPGNPGGLFAADQPIELAPSKDAPWEDAVAAFNAITRAGYTRVSFARPQ